MLLLKKTSLLLLTCLVAVVLFGFVKAEEDPIKKAAAQLDKWVAEHPQEKVYLHFDKPYYAVGDDIWFKAYVMTGPKHQLSARSGALKVELINDRDSITKAINIPVINGLAQGDFALSDTLAEGNYRIRAYTNWMRNAGPEYFFDKTIQIGKGINSQVFTKTNYTYTTQNGQQVVNANINYADISGMPYISKDVNYQVRLNNKEVLKGKELTDAKGTIHISFINTQPITYGHIITQIKIGEKSIITSTLPIKAMSGKVDVQFFPESGNLVNGLPSKVAFKAVGNDGLGKEISGLVLDNNNQQVAELTTRHLGMGAFMLMPEAGKTYKAQIAFEDGSQSVFALPKAAEQGYIVAVNNLYDPDFISLRIMASPALAGTEINLVAQSSGNVCFAAKDKLEGGALIAKIPKDRFPSGIAQFTLFNATGDPINERIAFINRADGLKFDVIAAQQTYKPQEKVKLQVCVNKPDGIQATADFSVSVTDESKLPVDESDETTILSTILLSSDIKGYVEKPNYYFAHQDKQAYDDLDLLMLTQGYRRFEWKQLMNGAFPPVVYQPEATLQISGRVFTDNNKPVVNGKVNLFTSMGGLLSLDTLTDANGRFAFKNLGFKDSTKFMIQARTANDNKYVNINLDNTDYQIVTPNINAPNIDVNINSSMLLYLQNSMSFYQQQIKSGLGNHNTMLKEVVIKDKKEKIDHSSNINGAGGADQVITREEISKWHGLNMAQLLQGQLVGVTFVHDRPYSTRTSIGGGPPPPMMIMVDGAPADTAALSFISPEEVSSIEVLRSGANTAMYGAMGGGGIIIVNMRRGYERDETHQLSPGVITYIPNGYYNARTYYSPKYDDPKTNVTLADLRSTIYWNPNVLTELNGKAAIEYFNAGSKGSYRVVIEGIDSDGHIGRHVYRYKVE